MEINSVPVTYCSAHTMDSREIELEPSLWESGEWPLEVWLGLWLETKVTPRQDRQCTYDVTLRRGHVTNFAIDKQSVLHTMCVSVALVIQHVKRMRRVILSSVASPALQYFSTLSHKRHDFRGVGKLLNIKCVLISSTTVLWNTSQYNSTRCCYKCWAGIAQSV